MKQLSKADQQYLEDFIKSLQFFSQSIPEPKIAVKDINSLHIFCTDYWAKKLGNSTPEEIHGHKMCNKAYNYSPEIEEQLVYEDELVLEHRQSLTVLKVVQLESESELEPFYCLKTPILNPKTNTVVGIYAQGFNLSESGYQELMFTQNTPSSKEDIPKLSTREKQIIFLFLSNLSSQQIAETIGKFENKKISKSTIDSMFRDSLYEKFSVFSRPELYKKLFALGFANRIPKELLSVKTMILGGLQVY